MKVQKKNIEIFQDTNGKEPFVNWVESRSLSDRARIFARLDRIRTGNPGDYKSVGEEVFELRLHFGPGYRIYFGEIENTIILLLCGGDKSSQKKDIKKAKTYWKTYKKLRSNS